MVKISESVLTATLKRLTKDDLWFLWDNALGNVMHNKHARLTYTTVNASMRKKLFKNVSKEDLIRALVTHTPPYETYLRARHVLFEKKL
jgi:hypothetical protein